MQQEQPISGLALFNNHLLLQDPSAATYNYLRGLRVVSTDARNRIDIRLHDDNWRASWLRRANEFCNDLPAGTALLPGAPVNAGLERMIRNNEMADLVVGMDEFRLDATTQELCIQQLKAILDPPFTHVVLQTFVVQHATYVQWARATPGLFRSIISSVRAHPMNMIIQLGGLRVMIILISSTTGPQLRPYLTLRLVDYTIATLIKNVHLNLNRPALAKVCLEVLRKLIDMHTASAGVPRVHFLTSGEHTMPGFVMTLLHMLQDDDMSVFGVLWLMNELLEWARPPQYTAMLQAFDVGQAEEYILALMTSLIQKAPIQTSCLNIMHILYQIFPDRVRRPTDVLACSLQNLAAHGMNGNVRDQVINMMSTIVEELWSPTAPIRELLHGQNRPCVDDMMQVVVHSLREADPRDPFGGKCNCTTFFDVLSMLCENHPLQIARVNRTQTVQSLHQQFHMPIAQFIDRPWMQAYTRLTGILAGR